MRNSIVCTTVSMHNQAKRKSRRKNPKARGGRANCLVLGMWTASKSGPCGTARALLHQHRHSTDLGGRHCCRYGCLASPAPSLLSVSRVPSSRATPAAFPSAPFTTPTPFSPFASTATVPSRSFAQGAKIGGCGQATVRRSTWKGTAPRGRVCVGAPCRGTRCQWLALLECHYVFFL